MNTFLYGIILGCAVVVGSCIIFAASWYDLRATAKRSRLTAIQRRLRGAHQPHVAVLVDTSGVSLDAVAKCLDSIIKSRYRQLTICIVDDQQAAVKQFARTYRQRHPSKRLHYYAPRRTLALDDRFHNAYRQLLKHDLLLTLDAGDTISPTTIKQAVAHFSDDLPLGRLQLTRRSQFAPSLTSLLTRYSEASGEMLQKAVPYIVRRKLLRAPTGIMYRHSNFTGAQNTARKTHYTASIAIVAHPTTPIKTPRYPLLAWPISLASAYLLTFTSVIAATLQNSSLLLLTWLSLCVWILVALWVESATSAREKTTLTFGLLLAPPLLYLQAIWLTVILPINGLRGLMNQWHRTRHNTNRYSYQRYILDNVLTFKTWYEEMCPREVWYQDQRRTDD